MYVSMITTGFDSSQKFLQKSMVVGLSSSRALTTLLIICGVVVGGYISVRADNGRLNGHAAVSKSFYEPCECCGRYHKSRWIVLWIAMDR
jgi:hypothetical protein